MAVSFMFSSVQAASSCKEFVKSYLTEDGQMLEDFTVEDNPNLVVSIVPKSPEEYKKLKIDQSGKRKSQTYVKAKKKDKDGKIKSMGKEYRIKLFEKGGELEEIKKSYPLGLFDTKAKEVVTFGVDANGECYPESYEKGKELLFSAKLCKELHDVINDPNKESAMQCLMENMDMMKELTSILAKHDRDFKRRVDKKSKSTKTALGVSYKALTALENCANYGLYPQIEDAISGNYDPAEYFITNPASWKKSSAPQPEPASEEQPAVAN